MARVECPRCASAVALHEGRPVVTDGGGVELWHPSCFDSRHVVVEQPAIVVRRARRWPWLVSGATAIALGITIAAAHAGPATIAAVAVIPVDAAEPVQLVAAATTHELIPPKPVHADTDLTDRYPIPSVNGQPLDDLYPSLSAWTHPVAGAAELMPEQPSRHFGAARQGVERAECGSGHCGIDLDGPRGRAVVAVADGVVVRVERHELGLDGRSGRYVRIEHDDGTLTAYMHLDDVAERLEVGDHVFGGQYIGTLGATAVYASAPHLHFSLEVPNQPGRHGDNTDTHYVDAAPFLVRAAIAPAPDRRRATKPAM